MLPFSDDAGSPRDREDELRDRARVARNEARRLSAEYIRLLGEHDLQAPDEAEASRESDLEARLGRAVREYTSVLHDLGVPPERVVGDVKRLIASSAPDRRREAAALLPRIVTLAIEAYYGSS